MSVIAKLAVPAADFPLTERILPSDSEDNARLGQIQENGEQAVPYVWTERRVTDDLVDDLNRASHVADVTVVDQVDTHSLVRITSNRESETLFHALLDTDAKVLEANGSSTQWTLQLQFDDHDTFVEFYRWCIEQEIALEVEHVRDSSGSESSSFEFALTETQRETLLTAFRRGYFEVPRDTNLVGLAKQFGVSDTAVSQRLRRGVATLIATTLVESEEITDPPED